MTRRVQVDIAILGGGIVGLWTLARLRALGYSCVLLEADAIGAAQSLASQGIIHGGIKYALSGAASRASRAIADMPAIWNACLHARGPVNLADARVLSDHQYLWTTGGFGSRLVGLAASKVIRTDVARVEKPARPPVFMDAPRGVDLYRVDEPVLDVHSVLAALRDAAGGETFTLQCAATDGDGPGVQGGAGAIDRIAGAFADHRAAAGEIEVRASRYILAAGAGNAGILERCGMNVGTPNPWNVRMQRRPLHMVMLRSAAPGHAAELPALFGHCIGGGLTDKPRVTITTARDIDGRHVWYVGGQISEEGVTRSREEQLDVARRELRECLPWLPWDAYQNNAGSGGGKGGTGGIDWATFRIDRAEGLTPDGSRPDEPVIMPMQNMIVVWPTKLAFAPAAADRIHALLQAENVTPGAAASPDDAAAALAGLPRPPLGAAPWNDRTGSITWTS